MVISREPFPEVIREGRSITATLQPLSGISEMWQCLQTTPASRAYECASALLAPPGQTTPVIDVTERGKWPVKFELKPNWIWLAMGFAAAWIIKR